MPLTSPSSRRALKHTRSIKVEAFARDDGLWDVDAHLTDVKTADAALASGTRPAGHPVHDLWLRVTVDRSLNILDAQAVSDAVPYPGYCEAIGPAYKSLIGLNLLKGFRAGVKERLHGVAGCSHLTELALVLPTVTFQGFVGEVFNMHDGDEGTAAEKPFALDRCHALRSDGAVVAKYYPRWAVTPLAESVPS